MNRVLLAGIAIAAGSLFVPAAARAAASDVIHGGCGYATSQSATLTDSQNSGVIDDVSATTTGDTPPMPIGAIVTCWIEVNDIEAPDTRFSYSGDGVQAGYNQISFNATIVDDVRECQAVTYADGSTDPTVCTGEGDIQIPPPEVVRVIDEVIGDLPGVLDTVGTTLHNVECGDDPSDVCSPVCRVTLLVPPGTYGPLTVAPDGDVYVVDPLDLGLNPVWDCPPFDNV